MSASRSIFTAVLMVTVTLAVAVAALFPFQEPGTGSWVVSIVSLAVQGVVVLVALAGLYFEWEPFETLDER